MLAQLLSPPYLPFALAFVVMIGIGLIEAFGLGLGHLDLGADIDGDAHVGLLDWLGLSEDMPVLIWLTSLLACFTLVGLAIQQTAGSLAGSPLPWWMACAGAVVAAIPLNTVAANGLARVMPGFESTVVSADDLVRLRGTVLEGTARRDAPARTKVVDAHGQAHFILVEPHDASEAIAAGETVLVVRREGPVYFVLPERNTLLRSI
ncbi:OB-fold-containig protein [Novosphingobium sp.]|uniref:OB-fold-containig protein n=1 Tax=Novosphingobium sp. TaxID=1874826 RepID=UPI003BAC7546